MDRRQFLKTAAGLFVPAAPALILPKFALAQGGMGPGPGMVHSTGGGGYTGPGDVVSGAVAWWGLRGYNAAYATGSNPCCDLTSSSGTFTTTFNILSDGSLDIASINAWIATNSITNPRVLKLYDQTGNARHMIRVLASAPLFIVGALGSYPATISFAGSKRFATSAGFTQAQTLSTSAAIMFPSHANIQAILADSVGFEFSINTTPALRVKSNTATVNTQTLSDNTWYAIEGLYAGSASKAIISSTGTGTVTTSSLNPGTNGIANSHVLEIGSDNFSEQFAGSMVEAGVWAGDITGSSPISNIRAYGGF